VSGRGDNGRDEREETGRNERGRESESDAGKDGKARLAPTAAPGSSSPSWLSPPRHAVEAELAQAISEARQREADEMALRRVWSQLSQIPDLVPSRAETEKPERRVRWSFVAAASLGGAVAAAAMFLVLSGPAGGRRLGPAPAAPVAPVATTAAPARPELARSTLVAPATVRTANGETLQLSLRAGAEVTVTSESTLVLDKDEQPTVAAGEVRFHVAPQPAGHHFTVQASSYRVVVVGTRFRVRVNGSNAAVGVEEGVVEIWKDTARVGRLTAGDSWISPPAESPGPRAAGTPSTEVPEKVGGETGSTTGRGTGITPSAPAAAVSRKRGSSAVAAVGARTSSNNVESISHRNSEATRAPRGLRASLGSGGPSATGTLGAGDRILAPAWFDKTPLAVTSPEPPMTVPAAAAPAPSAAPVPSSPSPAGLPNVSPAVAVPSSDVALATQARAARLAGEPRKALALYRTLAQRGGPTGENAEYEVARVLRDGLHQPAEAIAGWRAYRAQHPRGLLRVESDISIIETLLATNEKGAALAEAQEFVRRFPDGERRGEIGAMAADLLRERGDFRAAVAEYDGALASGRCRRDLVDSISFHRAVSLLHDDRDAGLKSLKAYVESFPSGRFRTSAERLLKEQTRALAAQSATD